MWKNDVHYDTNNQYAFPAKQKKATGMGTEQREYDIEPLYLYSMHGCKSKVK